MQSIEKYKKSTNMHYRYRTNEANLKDGATIIAKYFCHGLSLREKQILVAVIEIQKENWGGTTHFFRDNEATIILKSSKIQNNVWCFFPN